MTGRNTDVIIGPHRIGGGAPAYVIAELGVNHNGDIGLARRLIEVAAACGAQAAKLQSFSADRLVSPAARKAEYQKAGTGADETQHAMLKSLELDEAAHRALFAHAREVGITLISTPFDEESADLLGRLDAPAFKISSSDLTHPALLRHIAAKGRPMLVSTGMGTITEVGAAVEAIAAAGNPPLALLHCVSVYPADPADANLHAMATMRRAFGVPVGWSDHTTVPAVAWAAVALGAEVLEKHLTLDKDMPGPDHRASADPVEFAAYMRGIRTVEAALGDGRKRMVAAEAPIAAVARRSVVALAAIAAGQRIGPADIGALRPGHGIRPDRIDLIIGRVAACAIPRGAVIDEAMLG
jgi:sialic acid synthase SpsE